MANVPGPNHYRFAWSSIKLDMRADRDWSMGNVAVSTQQPQLGRSLSDQTTDMSHQSDVSERHCVPKLAIAVTEQPS